jgi:rare lipoprotein A
MLNLALTRPGRVSAVASLAIAAVFLAACGAPQSKGMVNTKNKRSKEYFAESEYGVKASPRVSTLATNLPRGGGRDQVGRPYKVRGQWYTPKEDPNYRSSGLASWYGDAFHGRLTANGEVYDKTHLTAAHPTMPLPSYARVTNKKNGHSVIVRVNDRGPFAKGRVIDLSQRAAEMLDYKNSGVAQVAVEYIGRAPLHGLDDQFLLASYRPGGAAPNPSDDGLPTGVMIAMNGTTPTASVSASPPPVRPPVTLASANGAFGFPLSYADERIGTASAVSSFGAHRLDADAVIASFARTSAAREGTGAPDYINAGTFASKAEALTIASRFGDLARTQIEADPSGHWFAISIEENGGATLDQLLLHAWANGAPDAMIVRD